MRGVVMRRGRHDAAPEKHPIRNRQQQTNAKERRREVHALFLRHRSLRAYIGDTGRASAAKPLVRIFGVWCCTAATQSHTHALQTHEYFKPCGTHKQTTHTCMKPESASYAPGRLMSASDAAEHTHVHVSTQPDGGGSGRVVLYNMRAWGREQCRQRHACRARGCNQRHIADRQAGGHPRNRAALRSQQ